MLREEELLSGIVIAIDKPRQWTSFQAVNKVKSVIRRLYGLKKFKIGHAGTLDPLATGLLLVCVGKATKSIPTLQDGDKTYSGTMVLGATTPCYDMEQAIDKYYPYQHITPELLDEVRKKFEGRLMQVPPMFSAVKVDGQRAYEYARADDPTVKIEPKPVMVHRFDITEYIPGKQVGNIIAEPTKQTGGGLHLYDNPQCEIPEWLPQAKFSIECGKGTYIRSIARDVGAELGSGAFLSSLRRERVGEYKIEQAVRLDNIEDYIERLTING